MFLSSHGHLKSLETEAPRAGTIEASIPQRVVDAMPGMLGQQHHESLLGRLWNYIA